MILQRLFAVVLLALCAILAVMAWPYQAAFSYEPVGPRAYPLLMLGLMSLGLLYLAIRPTPIVRKDDEPELDRQTLIKITCCVGLLVLFAATFEVLGFILSAILVGIPMARLYGGRWLHSTLVVVGMSVFLYWLFDRVMDVPLPLGLLSVLEN
ncbi:MULTISPECIES: tripartite tricarboxylate transporter TctB family protein [Pseudomonas]|uniref:Tripartite tricarboxylate transporter TctB family protein n=1 Tax=Pseudomonas promysalinigenes TaxID=485898 RepID=A0ABY6APQ9_9PSED|nr:MULTISPECIES: tripartite tricarboxylate transporter TctB family protein [Pseudomonas]QXI34699.1 tripartite tricarboxylate transporter TctB family protein [Pseudomonas promysalinigenes]UXH40970.1 tripartite tricarboxylate transporter TctB family protein [Pseudomonas promysalinigenes]